MQQPSPWGALSDIRLATQNRSRRNRFDQTALQNQAQYLFRILMTNCVIGVQSNSQEMVPSANASYKKVAKRKCKHQDQAKGLCRIMPWNREIDFDLNVSTITSECFQMNSGSTKRALSQSQYSNWIFLFSCVRKVPSIDSMCFFAYAGFIGDQLYSP